MIKEEVKEVIKEVLAASRIVENIDDNELLTGINLDVSSVEYVYIILELMIKYGMVFEPEDFENYKLITVNGIADCVQKHMAEVGKDSEQ